VAGPDIAASGVISRTHIPASNSHRDKLEAFQEIKAIPLSLKPTIAGSSMDSNELEVACYENEVPDFVALEMDRLYGNFFSSLTRLELGEAELKGINTYVVRKDHEFAAIFLFVIKGGRAKVLNEVIRIDSDDIALFARYIFAAFKNVNLISFKAIETDIQKIEFPHQRTNYSEDIAMSLPGTQQEYHASLGKNTRRNINRYTDKLKRSFPSFDYKVYEKDEVDEQQIHDIVALNRERMASKQKTSVLDTQETQNIIKRTKACGLVGVATIDGKICAGAISYCTGENYFLDVLAHDLTYNDYWVGILCCYMTICQCIARGGKEFHFLWGRYDYKFTLGATLRDLDYVVVYRSRLQFFLNGGFALKTALSGYVRKAKVWLNYKDSFLSNTLLKMRNRLRILKQIRPLSYR
jgi:hypothetical protein